MFKDTEAFSGFTTDDIPASQQFYEGVLGLDVSEENGMLTLNLQGGARPTLIYPKGEAHEAANFTVLNFQVEDAGEAARSLAAAGVEIERYPGMEHDDDGVMRGGGPPIAWFKDPAGNVLSVIEA